MYDAGKLAAKSNGETLNEHVDKVLCCMEQIRSRYPEALTSREWSLLERVILFHDIGKIDPAFQRYLKKDSKRVRMEFYHNMLSGTFIDPERYTQDLDEDEQIILYAAVFFHHNHASLTILSGYEKEVLKNSEVLKAYIRECVHQCAACYDGEIYWKGQPLDLRGKVKFLKMARCILNGDFDCWNSYVRIKGLLHRCDYAGSAGLDAESDALDEGMTLGEKTKQFLVENYGKLRRLQSYMAENKDKNLIVTAATGSGKTEAALLWIDSGKGFFTLPLKVSINNIYERIHNKTIQYGPSVLLHSEALQVYAEQDAVQTYAVARQFSAPLTVCTIDQLLKFAYKYSGSELQLATLSYSKLIIDEIQSYSPRLLGTVIYALIQIHQLGGKFAITTATFPNIILPFLTQAGVDFVKSPHFYGDVKHRHCITLIPQNEFDYNFIGEQGNFKKVLIIVNKVERARTVYHQLRKVGAHVRLLHSRFLRKDRKILEEEIVRFGKSKECGIWVSTQIVEASLDIDFDMLFTEMCSMDSLLQRMGRVFRSREYHDVETPNVYILPNESGVDVTDRAIIHREIYDASMKALENVMGNTECVLLQEHEACDMKQQMVDDMYDILQKNGQRYYQTLTQQIKALQGLDWYDVAKDQAERLFRDIHSVTVIPESVCEERQEELEALKERIAQAKNAKDRIDARTELYGYTVSINDSPNLDKRPCGYFTGQDVYICNGTYDFCAQELQGEGFIPAYKDRKHPSENIL